MAKMTKTLNKKRTKKEKKISSELSKQSPENNKNLTKGKEKIRTNQNQNPLPSKSLEPSSSSSSSSKSIISNKNHNNSINKEKEKLIMSISGVNSRKGRVEPLTLKMFDQLKIKISADFSRSPIDLIVKLTN